MDKIKDDLVNKKLLHHKDNGVQSLVACCISDILRIYAPVAPYTDTELKDIFKLFIKMFKKLANPENGYYTQQVYLITRVAEVRSIILTTDLEDGPSLIESIFELFYDQSNTFNKKLEPIISDIMIDIFSEWDQITTPVLKLILNKFLTASKNAGAVTSSLTSSAAQTFNFTLNICNANPDRLTRQLTKFFSETIYESVDEGSEIDFKKLTKLHNLVVQIWKNVPEILGSVMGLMDDELNADNEKYRALATEAIGKILASQARINFVQVHKETWNNWMKKTLDISPLVRITWAEEASAILSERADILTEVSNGLSKTLIDTDERVRLATIKGLSNVPADVLVRKVNSKTILNSLIKLAREKHDEISEQSIKILGSLYQNSYADLFNSSDELNEAQTIVKQIPSQILNLFYINNKNINYLVDTTLLGSILPQELDDSIRIERVLNVVGDLDDRARSAFIAFNKRQQQLSNVLAKFIEFAEANNGDSPIKDKALESKIDKTIDWLAVGLSDKFNPRESLERFIVINNRRLYYLIKICISHDSDYVSIINSSKELFQRLGDSKIINSIKTEGKFATQDILNTFKTLILRSSLVFFNKSNIAPLLKFSAYEKFATVAQQLINDISVITPDAFQNQVEKLVLEVKNSKPGTEPLQVNTLRALYHIYFKLQDALDNDDKAFFRKLMEFAQKGTPLEARYSVKIISLSTKKDVFDYTLFENVYPLDAKDKQLASKLASIAELFLTDPDIPEEKANDMTSLLIKDILLKNKSKGRSSDPSWVEDSDLEAGKHVNLYLKLLALEIFTNRLISLDKSKTETDENIKSIAGNVLKLLVSLIGNGGEIVNSKSSTYPTPKFYQTRLRLAAGLNLLQLARIPRYNRLMDSMMIERVILLIQDENERIRSKYIRTITDSLKKEEISLKFLPTVFFSAFEPNKSLKEETKTWIRSTYSRRHHTSFNDIVFEKSITGLIYSIAHHAEFIDYMDTTPDEDEDEDDHIVKAYTFALEYITFFLDTVANEKNVSLIYYLAARVKQYRDISFTDEQLENNVDAASHIYKVADLTLMAIKELQDCKGWTLQTYPGKILLSSELFKPMKDVEEGQDIVSTSFISHNVAQRMKAIVRQRVASISNQKRIRSTASSESGHGTKKVRTVKSKQKTYKRKKSYNDYDDADENDDLSETDGKTVKEPLRKSLRVGRISYVNQVKPYEEGEGEDDDEEEDTDD